MTNLNRFCFVTFIISMLLVVGCTKTETPLNTPKVETTASSTHQQEGAARTATKVQLSPTPSTTPITPMAKTPLVTPTSTPPSFTTETPAVEAPSLRSVSSSDQVWSTLVQHVSELGGFYILALSPDGGLFASVDSYDDYSKVYMWEVETSELMWVVDFDQPLGHSGLAFSPDGQMVAISTSTIEQDVFVLDVASGNQIHHFQYLEHPTDLKFSPTGKLLAISGFIPGGVETWNLEDGSRTEIGRGMSIDFVPGVQEELLAIAIGQKSPNDPSSVYLLDLRSGERDYLFSGSFYSNRIAVSPNGQYLAAKVANEEGLGNIRLLDLQNNVEIPLEGVEQDELMGTFQISFSDKDHLIVLERDLNIWNTDGQWLASLDGENIERFIITPDGEHLITFGFYETPMEVWELP